MTAVSLVYPDWLREMTRGKESAFANDEPTYYGVSGGKTSGLMSFLAHEHGEAPETYYGFQNTGEEHSQTYLFLQRFDIAGIGAEWSEFRKPVTYGAAPKEARYEIVTPETASRCGEPFDWFLETTAEYRNVHKGLGPIRPSGAMRLCTAFMKARVAAMVLRDRGWVQYTKCMGLRADEPSRVGKMRANDTRDKTTRAPLAEIGITKQHVNRFWSEQPFTLGCPDNLGNCQLCFLKDEADLAHNMLHDVAPEATQRWIDRQKKYGNFRERDYAQLLAEAPTREYIRDLLPGGLIPPPPPGFTDTHRYKLLIRQEQKILVNGLTHIVCNCEASELLTDEHVLEAM
jgi:hypothetical protein